MSKSSNFDIAGYLLLMLFLLLHAPVTLTEFTMSQCIELTTLTKCECKLGPWYDVICPTIAIEIYARNAGKVSDVFIECIQMDNKAVPELPTLDFGNVSYVAVNRCNLTSESINYLFERLGIRNVKTLLVELTSLGVDFTRLQLKNRLNSLEKLMLIADGIKEMPDDFFVDFPNIKTLTLKENFLKFSQNIFANLKNLRMLDLTDNNLEQLPQGIFRKQQKLFKLDLSRNNLRQLNKTVFEGAAGTSLQKLDLSSNGIESLQTDVFALLTNLTEIDLSKNRLYELPAAIFAHNKNLEVVRIVRNYNFLKCSPAALFANLPQLQELYITCMKNGTRSWYFGYEKDCLSEETADLKRKQFKGARSQVCISCDIDEISGELFTNSGKFTAISLANNELLTLPVNTFYSQYNAERLDLSLNKLQSLPDGLFRYTSNLIKLKLSHNQLTELSGVVLALSKLEQLYLDNNKLQVLSNEVFCKTTKLIFLKLSYNQLSTLSVKVFAPLTMLEQLQLEHNRLHTLPDGLFSEVSNLVVLRLSHNYLTGISAQIFSPLVKLETLYLDNNCIITIDLSAFRKTKNLRYLNMENNRIKFGDPFKVLFPFPEVVEMPSPFAFLSKLKTLKLRNNSIERIYFDWRTNLVELKELDLSFNNITMLNYSDLEIYTTNALFINISNNHIKTINFTSTSTEDVDISTIYYGTVNLNKNPLVCDCKILPFVQYLRRAYRLVTFMKLNFITDDLICARPDIMKNVPVRDIQSEALRCPIDRTHCPFGCSCWERTYDEVLIVNCSNANLTEVPRLPPTRQTFSYKSIELHVELNKLLNISGIKMMPEYAVVSKIYAAFNNLSEIDVDKLPTTLTYLDLSHNNFKRLNVYSLNFFNRSHSKIKLALAGSPWDCACSNMPLMQFVQQNFSIIIDVQSIYCAHIKTQTMLEYIINHDICRGASGAFITLTSSLLCAGFLLAFTAAFYYKFKNEIDVWMFKYRWLRWLIEKRDHEKHKRYDAFISYSHKNAQFVEKILVPELEEHGPIRFKLCVHVRDFIVGEYIPDQIVRAIDESRRTIFVLSRHFIESLWARMEFRAAHQAALNEGHTRLIVIIYDDIGDMDSLDSVLKAYLKTNTYLKWDDPRFWDRLRFAMPHTANEIPFQAERGV